MSQPGSDAEESKTTDDKEPANVPNSAAPEKTLSPEKNEDGTSQRHVSKFLDDVLHDQTFDNAPAAETKETSPPRLLTAPLLLDLFLGLGLLVACFGFTVGVFHMYLNHAAIQAINQQNYQAAIVILRGAPLPEVFSRPGSDTEELLSKAIYLDAMSKFESESDPGGAMEELRLIRPGSKYFVCAQQAIDDNTEPALLLLEGGAEKTETQPAEPADNHKSLLEKAVSSPD